MMVMAMVLSVGLLLPYSASASSLLLGGQHHYYTIQMRSDEQTIVYAKIIFEAAPTEDRDSVVLSLPSGVTADNLSSQQILAKSDEKKCEVYETYDEWYADSLYSSSTTQYGEEYLESVYQSRKTCVQYATGSTYDEDFDYVGDMESSTAYYSPYYYSYSSTDDEYEYKEAEINKDGQQLTISLPNSVKASKQGALLISFTTRDFISGFLGRYTYKFHSLIADQSIEESTVAVNFDDDLYSREAEQSRTSDSGISLLSGNAASGVAQSESYSSRSTDNLQNGIGQGGRYTQTQGKMLPGDTLEVRGVFATSPYMLMLKEFIITLIVLALIVSGIIFYRRWRKKHPKAARVSANSESTAPDEAPRKWYHPTLMSDDAHYSSSIGMLKLSLESIGAVAIIGIVFSFIMQMLTSATYSSVSSAILAIVTVIVVIVVMLFGLVIIPLLTMLPHGIQKLKIWAFIQTGCILAVLLIIALLASTV